MKSKTSHTNSEQSANLGDAPVPAPAPPTPQDFAVLAGYSRHTVEETKHYRPALPGFESNAPRALAAPATPQS
jgi:hypothetical protein